MKDIPVKSSQVADVSKRPESKPIQKPKPGAQAAPKQVVKPKPTAPASDAKGPTQVQS